MSCRKCGKSYSRTGLCRFFVEDRARPFGSRIVSICATIFATDDFCSAAQSTLPPYLGVQIARHYLSDVAPVLQREQVAQANAREGLNVIMCFEGWKLVGLSPEQVLAVREKQSEAFHMTHAGYRIREVLADAIDDEELHWMLDAGAHVRRDYASSSKSIVRPQDIRGDRGSWD